MPKASNGGIVSFRTNHNVIGTVAWTMDANTKGNNLPAPTRKPKTALAANLGIQDNVNSTQYVCACAKICSVVGTSEQPPSINT